MSESEIDVDELRKEIRLILKDADLNKLSSKKVRQMLENHFHRDFTERKKEIDQILMDEITQHHSFDDQQSKDLLPSSSTSTSSSTLSSSSSNKKSKKKMKSNSNEDKRIQQSDEELAMIIHQEENRPSLRHSRPTRFVSSSSRMKSGEKRKNCYNKDLQLSDQLANVVGGEKMPRSEVVKRMWIYFKEHQLMDPQNKQFVNCDDKLTKLFGRKRIRAFGMLKDLSKHMTDPDQL